MRRQQLRVSRCHTKASNRERDDDGSNMGAAGSSDAAISKQIFNLKLTSKQLSKVCTLIWARHPVPIQCTSAFDEWKK